MRLAKMKCVAMLLCLAVLLCAVACGGNTDTPEDTQQDTTQADITENNTTPETNTEAETEPPAPEISIALNGESATVTSTKGLTYTATGFSSVEGDSFVFDGELTLSLDAEQLAAAFNRFLRP